MVNLSDARSIKTREDQLMTAETVIKVASLLA